MKPDPLATIPAKERRHLAVSVLTGLLCARDPTINMSNPDELVVKAYCIAREMVQHDQRYPQTNTLQTYVERLERSLWSAEQVCTTQLNLIHELQDKLGIPRS